jgi:hypothetical protein
MTRKAAGQAKWQRRDKKSSKPNRNKQEKLKSEKLKTPTEVNSP